MKKLLIILTLLTSIASIASDSFQSKVERYNLMVQTGAITVQDFTDLVAALKPKAPTETIQESREERVQRWEELLERSAISNQDYRDLTLAQDALEN